MAVEYEPERGDANNLGRPAHGEVARTRRLIYESARRGGGFGVADDEEDFGWDGGWTNAIDHGHGLAELMLGNVHPYDRDDGYIPDPSFATRPEVWKGDRYADGPDNSTDPAWRAQHTSVAGGRPLRNRPQGETEEVGSGRNGTSSDRARVGTRSPRPVAARPPASKAERKALIARSLGLSAVDVQRVRRIEQDTGARQPRATTAARRSVVAKALGISVEELRLLRRALSGDTYVDAAGVARVVLGKGKSSALRTSSGPPRLKPQRDGVSNAPKSKKKTGSPRATRKSGQRQVASGPPSWRSRHSEAVLPPVPFCNGCEQPIRPNGRCGCS